MVIKEGDNDKVKERMDKRQVKQKRLMAMKRALRRGYGCGCGCVSRGRLRNRWQPIADMSVKRLGATSGVVCGRLVVVGGRNGGGVLSSGEMYDPRTNRWQPIADMSVGRECATSGVVCGRLVVVGGISGSGILSSGEMYY